MLIFFNNDWDVFFFLLVIYVWCQKMRNKTMTRCRTVSVLNDIISVKVTLSVCLSACYLFTLNLWSPDGTKACHPTKTDLKLYL